MFFLSLEKITVAFRTVLDELLCFFLALNLTSFQYFCQESFFFAFLFAFQRKFGPKIPAKIPQNRPFSPRICLFKSREISRFSRELSEALFRAQNENQLNFNIRRLCSEPFNCSKDFLSSLLCSCECVKLGNKLIILVLESAFWLVILYNKTSPT